jgi:hypothetical protein
VGALLLAAGVDLTRPCSRVSSLVSARIEARQAACSTLLPWCRRKTPLLDLGLGTHIQPALWKISSPEPAACERIIFACVSDKQLPPIVWSSSLRNTKLYRSSISLSFTHTRNRTISTKNSLQLRNVESPSPEICSGPKPPHAQPQGAPRRRTTRNILHFHRCSSKMSISISNFSHRSSAQTPSSRTRAALHPRRARDRRTAPQRNRPTETELLLRPSQANLVRGIGGCCMELARACEIPTW